MRHKIIAVTPAGRKRYLEILKNYILKDNSIDEWHLWDNCRKEEDRKYIEELEKKHNKIKVIRVEKTDGTNRSVNQFYQLTNDINTFYIKIDDDIVYMTENLGEKLYSKALSEKDNYVWWSPLVVNNAICSYIFKHLGVIDTKAPLSAQASCFIGWRSPVFCNNLHNAFLNSIKNNNISHWLLNQDFEVSLSRFSINTIGYFGETVKKLGEKFCPLGVDDEEYISATLPLLLGKPGKIIGSALVSHFAFNTQEEYLLRYSNILDEYAKITGLEKFSYQFKAKDSRFVYKVKKLVEYVKTYAAGELFDKENSESLLSVKVK